MRAGVALLLVLTLGCSSTVHRIGGEVKTPAGKAETPCEESAWYVLTPTRVDPVYGTAETAKPERQGLGLYRVGGKAPVSIPAASVDLGSDPMLERHSKAVEDYDRDSVLSTAFTGAGLVALTIGTVIFVTAFETTHSAGGEEEQRINSGRAYTGAIVGGLGIGLSVTGLVFNPTQAQRADAEAARYVFLEPEDDPDKVIDMVAEHNREVSKSCNRLGGSAAAKDDDDEAEEDSEDEVADDELTDDEDADDDDAEDVDLDDEDSASDEDDDY
jgi:hypothetical protein